MLSLRDGLGSSQEALKPEFLDKLSYKCHQVHAQPLCAEVDFYSVSSIILLEMFLIFLGTFSLLLLIPSSCEPAQSRKLEMELAV